MSDLERVRDWLTSGALLAPLDHVPGTVDLACAIATIGGAPGVQGSERVDALVQAIGDDRPVLFVLVDGLGCNVLERLPADAFLRRARQQEIRAVFPSTTAAALTSLATGAWPAEHAVPAWFTYLPEAGVTATILPFVERFEDRPLQEYGVRPEQAFPYPSLYPTFTRPTRTYHPAAIANSEYTRYQRGDHPGQGYADLDEAFVQVLQRLKGAPPGLHYLYLPMVDAAGHRFGAEAPEVATALGAVDAGLERLATALGGSARIAISADHGMISVPREDKVLLEPDDPLLAVLATPPHGEPRVPMFRVRGGRAAAFQAAFRERFADRFALLSIDEAEMLQLFGPGRIGARARARIGDFLALAPGREVLIYNAPGSTLPRLRGFHAGLRPEEMRIPLILA